MELLAILSTIILVGTIATLILAVAAYILYKARGGRQANVSSTQSAPAVQHHVLTASAAQPTNGYAPRSLPSASQPFPFQDAGAGAYPMHQQHRQPQPQQVRPVQAATYVPPQHLRMGGAPSPEHWEYGAEAFAPVRRDGHSEPLPGRTPGNDYAWLG